jgi:ADP-ribose pyrophosphatase
VKELHAGAHLTLVSRNGCEYVERPGVRGVAGEAITVHEVPVAAVEAELARREAAGALVDPKVWAGLWFARRP